MSSGVAGRDLPRRERPTRRRLKAVVADQRAAATGIFVLQIVATLVALREVDADGRWPFALRIAAWVFGLMYALPFVISGTFLFFSKPRPKVGRYTRSELEALVKRAAASAGVARHRIRIDIDHDARGVNATTAFVFPGFRRLMPIEVTSGTLHYLDENELGAVLVHEIAHHEADHRTEGWIGLVMPDVTAVAVLAALATPGEWLNVFAFFGIRAVILKVLTPFRASAAQPIEHLCDLFASERLGPTPLANALLKMGEENEIVETITARVASRLRQAKDVGLYEIRWAIEETRPEGRIFHDSIPKHVAAVIEKIEEEGPVERSDEPQKELVDFLEERRKRIGPRVRWRDYDREDRGRLDDDELRALVDRLSSEPDVPLFRNAEEQEPSSHPPMRDRLLVLMGGSSVAA